MQHQNLHTAEDYFFFFKEGEERGLHYFYQQFYSPLIHFALTFLNNTATAEDVAADSFIKLWERREDIQSASAIKPYLYACVRNACIDTIRKQKHQIAYEAHIKKMPVPLAPDITQNIITSQAMHQVYLALQNLPSKYQQVFKMIYVEGKEVKDVALQLNLPLSTVKSQKARALELLRKQLPHLGCFILLLWH